MGGKENFKMNSKDNFNFWWRWLVVADVVVMLFGISMILASDLLMQFFSLVFYASPLALSSFQAEAVAYIRFAHGVMGAVNIGWGAALMFTLLSQFRNREYMGWLTIAVSMSAWFLTDTAFSIWSGFWQNAISNLGFAILFAIPLAATKRTFLK
jgi:hypothetical protein